MKQKKSLVLIEIAIFILILGGITYFYYFKDQKTYTEEEQIEAGIISVNDETFEEEVLKSDKPVIVEFTESSCPPCLAMAPTIIDIAKNNKDIKVCNVNTDKENTKETSKNYNIEAYPTIIIFKDGKATKTFVGATSEENILKEVK